MNIGDIFYRYDNYSIYDDKELISCSEYKVSKITPKGCFLEHGTISFWGIKHFILTSAKKKFAYPTKEEALYSFIKRKERQISILEHQLKRANRALYLAEELRDEKEAI